MVEEDDDLQETNGPLARVEEGKNVRASSDLECSSAGAGSIIGLASRGLENTAMTKHFCSLLFNQAFSYEFM